MNIKIVFSKIYYFLIFTNMLIAFAAVAQSLLTYVILNSTINPWIVLIEGTSTMLLYNFSLWLSKPRDPQQSVYLRTRWVFSHQGIFWLNTVAAVLLIAFALLHIHGLSILFLLFIGFISLLYGLPLFKVNGKYSGLRQVPGLKVFHIALIWSLSTVGLPVIEMWAEDIPVNWFAANYLGLLKILFLLICTLPFDIRDIEQDSYYHLKTIPVMIGKRRSEILCYVMTGIHIILILFAPHLLPVKFGLILTNIVILACMHWFIFRNRRYHQVYLLDMALILQFLIPFLLTDFII